jgi:hypothetical protein
MHLFWTKSSKPMIGIGILAPPRLQKWVSILQINGGITSIFSQLLNTLVIYFFTKCDCSLFFFTFSFRDLSNNELTGTVPEAFAQLPDLTIL